VTNVFRSGGRGRWLVASVAVLGLSLLGPGPARADVASTCVEAAEHAEKLRRKGQLSTAHEELEACSQRACPSVVRRDCAAWQAEFDKLGSVVVKVEDAAGNAVTDFTASVDGRPLTIAPDKPTVLDPGEHVLRFEHPPNAPVEERVTVQLGEKGKLVSVKFPPVAAAPAPPLPPPPPPPRGVPTLTWILGGAGVAAIGTGVAFWAMGLSDRSGLASTCAVTHSCTDAQVSGSRSKLIAGDVLAGVGVLSLGGAVVVAVIAKGAPRETGLALVPTRAGAVVACAGRF
jgi:hypothetical protein